MTAHQVAFIVLFVTALGVFGWTLRRFSKLICLGAPDERSFTEWPARFVDVLKYFFGQMSVARERMSRHHLPIFWGFLVITLGTTEILINGIIPAFSFAKICPTFDHGFKAVLDITNGLVLLVIIYAFYRRLVIKPNLIPMNWDAGLILGMIATLCLTHFTAHGFHFVSQAGSDPRLLHAAGFGPAGDLSVMPISAAVFSMFRSVDSGTAHLLSGVSYWVHVAIVLFFLNYIPYSKHVHLLGAFPNILLRNRDQGGVMPKLDLEDETQWGVGRYHQFPRKSLLDSFACTECARCSNNCPAMATDKPLSPMHLVLDIRDEVLARGDSLAKLSPAAQKALRAAEPDLSECTESDKKIIEDLAKLQPMVGGRIKEETLWACTTCGACEANCPVFIEHPLKILRMRTNLVLEQEKTPPDLARLFRGMENNQNPWGFGADQRMDWAQDLDLPIMAEKGGAEYLVWIGCAGCYDDQAKKISRAWVGLLQQAGVDFAVLGDEETCTGDFARRAGNELLFQMLAEGNVEVFKQYDVKKILVTCPHCYHSLKHEYPQFGGNYEVWHHTQFIEKLIAEGKLKPAEKVAGKMVFHDPCYLGRWNKEYEAPRNVMGSILSDGPLLEMPRHHEKSFCCGAGGGRLWVEEEKPRVNNYRAKESVETGATTVVTACPFCNVMLTDGLKDLDKDEDVAVTDIAQLVARAAGSEPKKKTADA